jgi:hypothetical protein
MKGLFNKVKNRLNHQRFVVSTVRKGEDLFETAVFAAPFFIRASTFFYAILYRFGVELVPKSLPKPDLTVQTHTRDEAWDMHYQITARLTTEYPARLFQEFPPS